MMHANQQSLQLNTLSQTLQYWLCQTFNFLLSYNETKFVTQQKKALELSFYEKKTTGL
jgi:hypothetical protein